MEGKILKHSIVYEIPSSPIPEHIYILDNKNGTHTVYVSDENGYVVPHKDTVINIQAGENVTVDNSYPNNPVISVDLSNYGKTTLTSSDRSVEVVKSGDNYDLKVNPSLKNINGGSGIEVSGDSTEPVIGLKIKSDDGSVEITDSDGFKNLKVAKVDVSDKANKDASGLTDGDIVAWKEVLGVTNVEERDTLQSVTDRGNETTNPIRISRNYVDSKGVEKKTTTTITITGNSNASASNLLITNTPKDFQEKNKDSYSRNVLIGNNNAYGLINSDRNTLIGFNALVGTNGTHTHTLISNTAIGYNNITVASRLSYNTIIGSNNRIFNGKYLTPPDTGYYPIWGNLINGDYTNNAWGSYYGDTWTAEKYKNTLKSMGLINEDGHMGPFHNTIIGNGIRLASGHLSVNAYQSIWIGSNVLESGFAYKFCGNIFMGNEIYCEHPHDRPSGAIVIGNYLKIGGRNSMGELAIHNSTHQPTHWNNALIRGNFNTRYLKINGKFQVNPDYAVADNSYTKEVVAKVDGTLGIRDKVVPEPNLPADIEEYDLISSLPGVIDKGNPNAPVGKLMVNNKTGLGTITIDIISNQNFNSNVDLVQLPDNCPWVPLSTIENDLPVPPHTRYITRSGTLSNALLKDVGSSPVGYAGQNYTYSEALKNIYIIKNNRKIRGNVFPGIRTRTSFTTLFRKI